MRSDRLLPGCCPALALALVLGCASTGPVPASASSEACFVDSAGNGLERFDDLCGELRSFFGPAMPERIVVHHIDGAASLFDSERAAVAISSHHYSTTPRETLAHESSHVALARLTGGLSTREPYRFLDEGLASIREAMAGGDLDFFRRRAFLLASRRLADGGLDFARLQRWSVYFGLPREGRTDPDAYLVGATVVFLLLDRYGEPGLRGFFERLGKEGSLDAALRPLGTDAAGLERDWLARLAEPRSLPEPPRVARTEPADGAREVSPGLRQVRAELSVPMDTSRLCVQTSCDAGLCYTGARWQSDRVLVIDVEPRLAPSHEHRLVLGTGGCRLRSREGGELAPTPWVFFTGPEAPSTAP